MTMEQIISDLDKKIYHPVYFLMGEEPYFIDRISEHILKTVLGEAEREFNQTVLYGRDTDVQTILSAAKRFPMMANYQVVVVREAQNLRKIEEIEAYLQSPQPSTILVFCYKYKKVDRRKTFAKTLKDRAVLFQSDPIREYKIPDWITKRVQANGMVIGPKASHLIAEYLGTDLSKIENAIQKLILNNPKNEEVSTDMIQQYVGINKDYNNFELQGAVGKRDILKANQIAQYFTANSKDHPLLLTVGSLYNLFVKILLYHQAKGKASNEIASILKVPPFFVRDYATYAGQYSAVASRKAIGLLKEFDLKSKGFGNASASEGDLLKELLWKIMHN